MKVKKILIAEFDVSELDTACEDMNDQLDRLREGAGAEANYGVTLYQATREDLEEFAAAGALLPYPQFIPVTTKEPT